MIFGQFEEDEHGKWLVLRCRMLENPIVTGTKQSLNIIERENNVSVVPEPYAAPLLIDGALVKISVSAIVPNPDAPPREEKLTPREKALLSDRAEALTQAQFAASMNTPQMQQALSLLAKQITGMK